MASQDISRKVLARAAALIGVEALAERLQMSARILQHYLTGHDLIPDELFLRAVDVIVEQLPQDGKPLDKPAKSGDRPSSRDPKTER